MKRPTERQAERIERKIEALRTRATDEFFAGRYGRNQALNAEADKLEAEYRAACGLTPSAILREQLVRSLSEEAAR